MSNDAPGNWLFHCHVNSHLDNGMLTTYTVKPAHASSDFAQLLTSALKPMRGVTRTYYIQAEEVLW
jgi:hephaestin